MGGVDQRRHRPRLHRNQKIHLSVRLCSPSSIAFVLVGCSFPLVAMTPVVVAGQDHPRSSGSLSSSSPPPPDSPLSVVVCLLLDSDLVKNHRKSRAQFSELDAKSKEHRSLCTNSYHNRVSLSIDVSELHRTSLRRCIAAGTLKSWISSLSILNRRDQNGDIAAIFLLVLQWRLISTLSPLSTVYSLRSLPANLVESLCAPSTLFRVSPPAGTDASPQSQSLKLSFLLFCPLPGAMDRRRTCLRSAQIHGGGWGNTLNPNGFIVRLMGSVGPWFIFIFVGYLVVSLGVNLGNNGLNYVVVFQFILVRWAFSLPWDYGFNEIVTSLPIAHSSVRESLSPPLEKASPRVGFYSIDGIILA